MKQYRLICLCLSFLLIAGGIIGCSSTGEKSSGVKGDTVSLAQEQNTYDLKGRNICITIPDGTKLPEEGLEDKRYAMLVKRKNAIEIKYNCKIEWKSGDENINKFCNNIKTAVASGQAYSDIVGLGSSFVFPEFANKNIIIPLDSYIDFKSGVFSHYSQNGCVWNGKHYGVTYSTRSPGGGSYITYNKDLFASEGLEDPFELFQKGVWTWDAFLNAATTATKDKNGDGATDQWGIDGSESYLYNSFLLSNNAGLLKETDAGFRFGLSDEDALEALKFVSDLYNVHEVVAHPKLNAYNNGCAAMLNHLISKNFTNINSGLVLYPKGLKASDYVAIRSTTDFYAIPATTPDPEVIARIMSELVSIWDISNPDHLTEEEVFGNTADIQKNLAFCDNDLEVMKAANEKQKDITGASNAELLTIIGRMFNSLSKPDKQIDIEIARIKDEVEKVISDWDVPEEGAGKQ